MRKIKLLLLALIAFQASEAFAQNSAWVDFADESSSRLNFNINDDQEKDMIVGDVDNDGDEDIVIVRKLPFSVDGPRPNLLLMNENGTLVDRTTDFIPTFISDPDNARDVLLFDANNNGWQDMIIANTFGSLPRLYINRGADANGDWLGYEDQGSNGEWFSPQLPISPQACGVAIGDVDGDGFIDLYFADYNNDLEARLMMNNGDNTFTDESVTRMSFNARQQAFGTGAFMADMNGDGALDIVSNDSVAFGGIGIELAINDGSGFFNQTQLLPSVTSYMANVADFNNDGRLDIYVIDDGQDYILLNDSTNADGTISVTQVFHSASVLTQNFNGNNVPADFDGDGFIDMVVSDVDVDIPGCDRIFTLLRNNNGQFMSDPNNGNLQEWNQSGTHDTVVIDINDDGNPDLFMATCERYFMYVNTADPVATFIPPAQFTTFRGIPINAQLSGIEESDDNYATFNPGFTLTNQEAPVWLVFDGTAPSATDFQVEANVNTPNLTYTVEAFNFGSGTFEELESFPGSFNTDSVTASSITPADHIGPNGETRARVGWRVTGFTLIFPWEVRVDHVGWNQ